MTTTLKWNDNVDKEKLITFRLMVKSGNAKANINMFYIASDANGISRLNINLMSGQYIITSSFNGGAISNKVTVTA